jgi:hypothetical protein
VATGGFATDGPDELTIMDWRNSHVLGRTATSGSDDRAQPAQNVSEHVLMLVEIAEATIQKLAGTRIDLPMRKVFHNERGKGISLGCR